MWILFFFSQVSLWWNGSLNEVSSEFFALCPYEWFFVTISVTIFISGWFFLLLSWYINVVFTYHVSHCCFPFFVYSLPHLYWFWSDCIFKFSGFLFLGFFLFAMSIYTHVQTFVVPAASFPNIYLHYFSVWFAGLLTEPLPTDLITFLYHLSVCMA